MGRGPASPRPSRLLRRPRAALAATLSTRRTQTNETARCAGLLPAFAAVADGRPLALIEIGASAGLNLRWDHYAYDYGGRAAGVPSSPLTIACELRGPHVPPLDPPPVAWRAGIDLSPVDASDPPTRAGCTPACGPTSPLATRGSRRRSRSLASTRSTSAAATRSRSSRS